MTALVPCPACKRHVATRETACPFCACRLPVSRAPRIVRLGRVSRAAVFSAALAACSEPAKQPPPAPAQGSDGSDDLEQLLDQQRDHPRDHQPRVVAVPDAGAPAAAVDAAIEIATSPVDAGVPDAGVAVKKKQQRKQKKVDSVDKQRVLDYRYIAKPYGAPPARRRVV